jgi:predicted acyl esterase
LFAKLYDVDPSGGRTLVKNLVSAARVPDVTKQVRITLPGVVHRFAAGHSVQLVLAASDLTYKGGGLAGPVSIVDSPTAPNVLMLPNVSAQAAALRPLARPAAPAAPSGGSLPTTGLPLAPGLLGVLLLLGAAGAIRVRHQAAPRS